MKKSGIYRIKHRDSEKFYIGSSNDIVARWRCHMSELRRNVHHNSHLQNAWNKYKERFNFEVVLYCDPEDLIFYEQRFLDFYKKDWKMLYNVRVVAESNRGVKKRPHSDATKRKMSEARRGKPCLGLRGKPSNRRTLSDEQVREIRARYTGAWGQKKRLAVEFEASERSIGRILNVESYLEVF